MIENSVIENRHEARIPRIPTCARLGSLQDADTVAVKCATLIAERNPPEMQRQPERRRREPGVSPRRPVRGRDGAARRSRARVGVRLGAGARG